MGYQFDEVVLIIIQSFDYVVSIVMGTGFIMLYLVMREKCDGELG
jgi:hypothetical protein